MKKDEWFEIRLIQTFDGVQKIFHAVFVQTKGLFVIFLVIFFRRFGNKVNSFLKLKREEVKNAQNLWLISLGYTNIKKIYPSLDTERFR